MRRAIQIRTSSTRAAIINLTHDQQKEYPVLSPRILVADLLDYSPLIVSLLLELRVDCVGCSLNKFCTLEDLCRYYGLDLENTSKRIRDELSKVREDKS